MEATGAKESYIDGRRRSVSKEIEGYLRNRVKDKPRVISVGCGVGDEAEPILRILPGSTYKGIDIDPEMIQLAKESNIDTTAEFEVADAINKEAFGPQPWDVVILRHPHVMEKSRRNLVNGSGKNEMDENWAKIIKNSIEALNENGIVFMTTFDETEKEVITNYLGQFGKELKILIDQGNQHETYGDAAHDNFVVMAQKISG